MLIYIAGPYTPRGCTLHDAARIAEQNTDKAIKIAVELIKIGHTPFIPHLTHYIHLKSNVELLPKFFYEYDMKWLAKCEALYYLSPSPGADIELKWAQSHGLKIYKDLKSIPKGHDYGKTKIFN